MQAPNAAVGDGALGFWAALGEVFAQTRQQRCSVHKLTNVLNYLPKSLQLKVKSGLQAIWMADKRAQATSGFAAFLNTYESKYPKTAVCLAKDWQALQAFYVFPAEHWIHLRTSNFIEATFAAIRHRTQRVKGAFSRMSWLAMLFKLALCAEQSFWRLRESHGWQR